MHQPQHRSVDEGMVALAVSEIGDLDIDSRVFANVNAINIATRISRLRMKTLRATMGYRYVTNESMGNALVPYAAFTELKGVMSSDVVLLLLRHIHQWNASPHVL